MIWESHFDSNKQDRALGAEIDSVLAKSEATILDAVCLEEVAPSARWGRGFVVYVKRLSFNNADPMWHRGFELEKEDFPLQEPHLGILNYHRNFLPHERADLIVELPEDFHTISSFVFDRSYCFDPAGAITIAF